MGGEGSSFDMELVIASIGKHEYPATHLELVATHEDGKTYPPRIAVFDGQRAFLEGLTKTDFTYTLSIQLPTVQKHRKGAEL